MIATFPQANYRRGMTACLAATLVALSLFGAPMRVQAQTSSLSLSPAVVMARGTFGQSLTQMLTINNQTPNVFSFEMVAEDVVVKDGKRVFMPAGEVDNSVAATAVFTPKDIVVPPFQSASVRVTVTLPQTTAVRAMVAVFRTKQVINTKSGGVGLTSSMGSLITFNLSKDVGLTPATIHVVAPTETTNLSFDQQLTNSGSEPIIPKGIAAILKPDGKLVGRTSFAIQRLLPGEKLTYHAEYPDQLPPGSYRAICTFEYEGQTESQQADFIIP